MDNAADRKEIRSAEKRARLAEKQRGEILIQTMSTAAGRQWVWDNLSSCHVFATTFNENPLHMAFLEGERNRGLALLSDVMQWCPDQFIQAMREANGGRSTTTERTGSTNGDGGIEAGDPSTGDSIDYEQSQDGTSV